MGKDEDRITKLLGEAFKRAIARATLLVQEDAIARCPRGNGELASKIEVDENKGIVYTNVSYAPIVEYGLKGKIILPKKGKVLAWTKPGVTRPDSDDKEAWKNLRKRGLAIFARRSKGIQTTGTGEDGEGITKISFLRPALWENKKEILNIFKEEIKKI